MVVAKADILFTNLEASAMRKLLTTYWKPRTRREFLKQAAGAGLLLTGSAVLDPFMLKPKSAHASQWHWVFRGSEAALITFRTDPNRFRKTVPEAFKPNDKGILVAWFAYERKVEPRAMAHTYHLAVLGIPVVFEGQRGFGRRGIRVEGLFIEQAYSDTGVSYAGRNYGYPLERAKIDWSADKSSIKSTVAKDGTQIAHVALSLSDSEAEPQPGRDVAHFNLQENGSSPKPTMTKTREEELIRLPGQVVEADLFGIEDYKVIDAVYRKYDRFLAPHSEAISE